MKRKRLTNEEFVKITTEKLSGMKNFFFTLARLFGVEVLVEEIERLYLKLKKYEDAEEQGLLVLIKHPVGTEVFILIDYPAFFEPIEAGTVTGIAVYTTGWEYTSSTGLCFAEEQIGKTVFFAREEAEKALEEMKK